MLTFKTQPKEYNRVPGGSHFAVCDIIAVLGLQETLFGTKNQVYIRFEIPTERWEYEKDGEKKEGPGVIGNIYTASMDPKANLRKLFEGWNGKKFTDVEASSFDVLKMLGKGCLLSVQESTKGDKTYSNIVSAAPLMKGVAPMKAELPLLLYHDGDKSMFDKLPEWIRKKIDTAVPEPDAMEPAIDYSAQTNPEITDNDIPF